MILHFSLRKVIKAPLKVVVNHLTTLYLDLDPVKDSVIKEGGGESKRSKGVSTNSTLTNLITNLTPLQLNFNLHYFLPLLSMLIINADIYNCLSLNNFNMYKRPEMDVLLSHRFFPPHCWPQGDVITIIGLVLASSVYLCLFFGEPFSSPSSKLIMTVVCTNQKEAQGRVVMLQNGRGNK